MPKASKEEWREREINLDHHGCSISQEDAADAAIGVFLHGLFPAAPALRAAKFPVSHGFG